MKLFIALLNVLFSLLLATTAFATPTIVKTQSFYAIQGDTDKTLRQQMDTLGPITDDKHFDAQTTWHINWKYTWQTPPSSQAPCNLISTNVTATINVLLPQWINQDTAPPELQKRWNTYMTALRNHEQAHEANGINAANEIDAALAKISSAPTCQELKTTIDNTANQILHQHDIWDQQYDIDTNHGKNQGVVFP